MYDNIKEKITKWGAEERATFEKMTEGITVGQASGNWSLTKKAAEKLEDMPCGERVPRDIVEKMRAKYARAIEKLMRGHMEHVELVESYEQPDQIVITVEWKPSTTWGMCPRATVTGEKRRTESRASGCGYDKESVAIASALNQNPEALRILYDHAEAGGAFPYGVMDIAGVPSFNGICGVSCFYKIFEACGYTFRKLAGGGRLDVYGIKRRTKK